MKECARPFSNLETERQVINHFTENKSYIAPKQFVMAERIVPRVHNSTVALLPKPITGVIVPLRILFKCFIELPNVLDLIQKYMTNASSCVI